MDWTLYRSFLAVCEEGSLSAAARTLGLTQPTLGRHVDQLEAGLGVPLFTRSRDGLAPTERALALLPHARAMAAAAAAIGREAAGIEGQPRGTVRITASAVMACEVLPAILSDFHQQEPGIEIELVASNRPLNLLTREADIAIRMVRPEQAGLVARRLGSVTVGLFAHRRYLERHGTPGTLEDLRRHALIGFDADPLVAGLLAAEGIAVERGDFVFRTDSDPAQLALLRAGAGIAGCHVAIGRREPQLVAVLPGVVRFRLDLWLAYHADLKRSLPVRLALAQLTRGLEVYLASERAPQGPERC